MFKSLLFKRLQQVVRLGSFAKAADSLYVTRPALVQQIKAAEDELGFLLFERSTKGVRLTPAGEHFMRRGEAILGEYERLLRECEHISQRHQDIIIIGTMPNLESVALSHICRQYRKEYPDSVIKFKEYPPDEYFAAFSAGEFDICCEYISCYHCQDPNLRFLQLRPTRHCVCMPPTDELCSKTFISFADLRGRKLMLYRQGITKCDDELRAYIQEHEPEIELVDIDKYDSSLIIRCEIEHTVLLNYAQYELSFPNFVTIPTNWNFVIERGVGYNKNCSSAVKNFLFEAIKLIDNENL